MYYDYDISPYARSIDNSSVAVVGGVLGAALGVYLIIVLAIAILQIVAMWKLYTKAGEKGWKSIIPIYNIVILFKISGLSPWLILVYLLGIIPFVGWIAMIVLTIYQANNLAKSFGKDIGYTVGLVLLAPIFYLILGFGKSEYIGPGGQKVATETVAEVTKVSEDPKEEIIESEDKTEE